MSEETTTTDDWLAYTLTASRGLPCGPAMHSLDSASRVLSRRGEVTSERAAAINEERRAVMARTLDVRRS